jgi:hypothetical protein
LAATVAAGAGDAQLLPAGAPAPAAAAAPSRASSSLPYPTTPYRKALLQRLGSAQLAPETAQRVYLDGGAAADERLCELAVQRQPAAAQASPGLHAPAHRVPQARSAENPAERRS